MDIINNRQGEFGVLFSSNVILQCGFCLGCLLL